MCTPLCGTLKIVEKQWTNVASSTVNGLKIWWWGSRSDIRFALVKFESPTLFNLSFAPAPVQRENILFKCFRSRPVKTEKTYYFETCHGFCKSFKKAKNKKSHNFISKVSCPIIMMILREIKISAQNWPFLLCLTLQYLLVWPLKTYCSVLAALPTVPILCAALPTVHHCPMCYFSSALKNLSQTVSWEKLPLLTIATCGNPWSIPRVSKLSITAYATRTKTKRKLDTAVVADTLFWTPYSNDSSVMMLRRYRLEKTNRDKEIWANQHLRTVLVKWKNWSLSSPSPHRHL